MHTTTPAPAPAALPAANTPAPTGRGPQLRRRDVLVGGLGAVAGVAGVALGRKPKLWAGDRVVPEGAMVSYAQFGDDLLVASLCSALSIEKPSYLDIGAFEPIFHNNTYLSYLSGGRGVLVEPNSAITDRLKTTRPRDTVLVAGIGVDEAAEADYYMLANPGLNTFDGDEARRISRETGNAIERVEKRQLLSINRVIAEHFGGKAPDLVSIDIEGLDYAVLKTLDFVRFRPKIVCAETLVTHSLRHNPDTTRLMVENGYEVRGMTLANTIYVDKRILPA